MGKTGNHGYYPLKTEMDNFFLLIPSPNYMGMGMDYPYPVGPCWLDMKRLIYIDRDEFYITSLVSGLDCDEFSETSPYYGPDIHTLDPYEKIDNCHRLCIVNDIFRIRHEKFIID